jgi:hypothetical protein
MLEAPFWNIDVMTILDGVLDRIASVMTRSIPPSLALPRKGGGDGVEIGESDE